MIVAMLALLLVALLIVGGALLGAQDPDSSTAPLAPATRAATESPGIGQDLPVVKSGPRSTVDQHQVMMAQMRATLAAAMVADEPQSDVADAALRRLHQRAGSASE